MLLPEKRYKIKIINVLLPGNRRKTKVKKVLLLKIYRTKRKL